MKLTLQKQINRKYGNKTYYKFVVVIPNKIVRDKKLGNKKTVEVELKC
jgi:hypothetical protein